MKASALLAAAGLVDALLGRRGLGGRALPRLVARHWRHCWCCRSRPTRCRTGRCVFPSRARRWRTPGSAGTEAPAEFHIDGRRDAPVAGGRRLRRARPRTLRTDAPRAVMPIALAGLGALYAAGVLILLVRFGREPFVLRRLTRTSREVDDPAWRRLFDDAARHSRIGRPVRLLQSAGELMPMTYGTRRPTLVLPASADAWTDDRRRAVLLHELAHVARRDCFVQRLTSLACALYWPHPGVWWAARRLRTERELACDDLVLAAGAGAARVRRPPPRSRALTRRGAGARDRARHGARATAGAPAARGPRCRAQPRGAAAAADSPSRSPRRSPCSCRWRPCARPSCSSDPPATAGTSPAPSAQASRDRRRPRGPARRISPARGSSVRRARPGLVQRERAHWPFVARPDDVASRSSRALTGTRIAGANGPIHLPIRREAGTFTVDGVCRDGMCGGTYGFEPNAAFAGGAGEARHRRADRTGAVRPGDHGCRHRVARRAVDARLPETRHPGHGPRRRTRRLARLRARHGRPRLPSRHGRRR